MSDESKTPITDALHKAFDDDHDADAVVAFCEMAEQSRVFEGAIRTALPTLIGYRECLINSYTTGYPKAVDYGYISGPDGDENAEDHEAVCMEIEHLNALIATVVPDDDRGLSVLLERTYPLPADLAAQVIAAGHRFGRRPQ